MNCQLAPDLGRSLFCPEVNVVTAYKDSCATRARNKIAVTCSVRKRLETFEDRRPCRISTANFLQGPFCNSKPLHVDHCPVSFASRLSATTGLVHQLMTDVEPASVPSFGGFGECLCCPSVCFCWDTLAVVAETALMSRRVVSEKACSVVSGLNLAEGWSCVQMLLLTLRQTTTTAKIMCTSASSNATAKRV